MPAPLLYPVVKKLHIPSMWKAASTSLLARGVWFLLVPGLRLDGNAQVHAVGLSQTQPISMSGERDLIFPNLWVLLQAYWALAL